MANFLFDSKLINDYEYITVENSNSNIFVVAKQQRNMFHNYLKHMDFGLFSNFTQGISVAAIAAMLDSSV